MLNLSRRPRRILRDAYSRRRVFVQAREKRRGVYEFPEREGKSGLSQIETRVCERPPHNRHFLRLPVNHQPRSPLLLVEYSSRISLVVRARFAFA